MKKSVKAALLSGLLFPGAGHFMLGRRLRGLALLVFTMLGLIIVVGDALQTALPMVDKIQRGEVTLNAQAISALAAGAPTGSASLMLNMAMLVIVGCWIVGMIDSYRIGCNEDQNPD